MPETKEKKFSSPDIADEMTKMFGEQARKVTVDMKYRREVGQFVRKIERAHKEARKSKLVFD